MALPKFVHMTEVGPRDGLQNEKQMVPVDVKVGLCERLLHAGVTSLEVHAADAPDRLGPARFVRVEVSSSFSWASLAQLTRRLAAVRPGVVVERASTDGAGTEARLHLVLLAPFHEGAG